ncbi:MAG TPA: arginine--tRNA ligase, partial [Nitrospina sp.]|nr:arginine--tRNA ligase [Nitrospina sp.]
MKKAIKEIIECALDKAKHAGELELGDAPDIVVEKPKDEKMGDFACNIAMTLARSERKNPKVIAQIIERHIEKGTAGLDSVEIAGPGFLNLKMSRKFFLDRLADAVEQRNDFGKSNVGQGTKIMIEFVSANPTGPLHIGHGRGAAVGDALARILKKAGYDLKTEYYVNDVGNQMNILGRSTWLRYLELLGNDADFPEDHYRGEYIKDIAQMAIDQHGKKFFDKPEGECV